MYSLMSPLNSGLGCQIQKQLQIITPKLLHKYYSECKYIDQLHKYCQIRILSMCKKTLASSRRRISLINRKLRFLTYHYLNLVPFISRGCSIPQIVKVYNQTDKALPLTLAEEGGDKNKGVFAILKNFVKGFYKWKINWLSYCLGQKKAAIIMGWRYERDGQKTWFHFTSNQHCMLQGVFLYDFRSLFPLDGINGNASPS